ncbi:hypothetical protein GA0111570_104301 [Raineyella antarctica]|uniref:Uncharacterized protein n=1 Tax=Raineyella antarctica TaxID=1577474 RepID=A0A1G6GRC5_9ACTN|nr:hypothetical protein [Raineyella antarctica]SDB84439.1 hypothetical protein GA0111570_104301 [Raineyella antarctica]
MTHDADLEYLLLPPDPDQAPGWRAWPAPVRRRAALCALLDRIETLVGDGRRICVLVPDEERRAWRGLGVALESYAAVSVAAADAARDRKGAERVPMPADAAQARAGRHGAAMLGARDLPVRHLGATVAGDSGTTPWTGPWAVITDEGWRTRLSPEALLDPVLGLRPGQRLQALVTLEAEPRLVSAWH